MGTELYSSHWQILLFNSRFMKGKLSTNEYLLENTDDKHNFFFICYFNTEKYCKMFIKRHSKFWIKEGMTKFESLKLVVSYAKLLSFFFFFFFFFLNQLITPYPNLYGTYRRGSIKYTNTELVTEKIIFACSDLYVALLNVCWETNLYFALGSRNPVDTASNISWQPI